MNKKKALIVLPSYTTGGAEKVIWSYFKNFKNSKISLKLLVTNSKDSNDNLKNNRAVIPFIKTENSTKYKKGNRLQNLDRDKLIFTQTPQCFDYKTIYKLTKLNKHLVTDEAALFLNYKKKIKFIEGEQNNFKITTKSDLEKLNIKSFYGIGFDIHRLIKNK